MLEGNSFKVLSEFPVSSFARTIHATNIEWTAPSGFAGRNRYHVLNPNAKSDRDKYLDKDGAPVRKVLTRRIFCREELER